MHEHRHEHSHSHQHDDEPTLDRRDFLRLAGASIALAGLDGCTRMPAEHILPYVDNRPELTPGIAQQYATAMMLDGYATGLIVESHDGRPTKIEGNPDHPASLGASGAIEQASVLQLYDPDRAHHARIGSSPTSWKSVAATLAPNALAQRVGTRGEKLRILIEPTSSRLDESLLQRVIARYPDARVHMYAPLAPDPTAPRFVRHYDLSAAKVIVAIDSDFLAQGPFHLRYARQFADGRRLAQPTDPMNRLYVLESNFTPTGTAADHRFAVRPRDMLAILRALQSNVEGNAPSGAPSWVGPIARDLLTNRGHAVVVVDANARAEMVAVADAINSYIGAMGATTWYAPSPLIGDQVPMHSITELVDALRAGSVDTLIVVGGNPAYATPASLDFAALMRKAPNAGYIGLYENETANAAHWFIPMSHYLESWGDARAYDGTLSIVQPLVNPLHESITPSELYATLGGAPSSAYSLVRTAWNARPETATDETWNATVQRGFVPNSAFAKSTSAPASRVDASPTANATAPTSSIDVLFSPDDTIHDGQFANNAWLQELPAPLTKLTWGNAALLSPKTARRVGVSNGDHITLAVGATKLTIPALIVPGHADDVVTVHFGYGRTGHESVARNVGTNVYALWPSVGTRSEANVAITRAPGSTKFAITQTHDTIEAARPIRSASLSTYRASPTSVGQRPSRVLSLYPEPAPPVGPTGPTQWAMTIDLSTCIGCGACTVACQAENNIPVVGEEQVELGRAMHWIRIDRYFTDHENEIDAWLQPMLCQHCEKAPCEYVCPVDATVHSTDGLNEMVYNRCVGTRFCSNNCPYKVRRFNWFDYNKMLGETELMVKNPNVTVRERGVMEKCTFCVQRIREAEIAAGRDGHELQPSTVVTACQQACPTNAIVFGSLGDANSEMVRRREQPRSYSALGDLGTEPRVKYLARIRNTNPELGTFG